MGINFSFLLFESRLFICLLYKTKKKKKYNPLLLQKHLLIWVFIYFNNLIDQFNTQIIDLKKSISWQNHQYNFYISLQHAMFYWSISLSFEKKRTKLCNPPPNPQHPHPVKELCNIHYEIKEFKWPVWPSFSRHFVDIILFQFVGYIGIAVWKVAVIFVILDKKEKVI